MPDGTVKSMPLLGLFKTRPPGPGISLHRHLPISAPIHWLFCNKPDGFNRMFVTVSEGNNDDLHLRQMTANVKDKVGENEYYRNRNARGLKTNEHPMGIHRSGHPGILLALGILILFLSSSLIANTLSALLNQHLRHIGVMKLIGGRRNQIFEMLYRPDSGFLG